MRGLSGFFVLVGAVGGHNGRMILECPGDVVVAFEEPCRVIIDLLPKIGSHIG